MRLVSVLQTFVGVCEAAGMEVRMRSRVAKMQSGLVKRRGESLLKDKGNNVQLIRQRKSMA